MRNLKCLKFFSELNTTSKRTNDSHLMKMNLNKLNLNLRSISDVANKIVDGLNPREKIMQEIKKNPSEEALDIRIFELNRYRLSLFLNREIQQEIIAGGDLNNSRLNNDILAHKFAYSEDKNNLFLHKRVEDYYILIHFSYMKPLKDQSKIDEMDNQVIKHQLTNFGKYDGFAGKLAGFEHDPDLKHLEKEDMIEDGYKESVERFFNPFESKDLPFNFNINLINKKSECLQYVCYSEATKVIILK
jgi:hypothetical protein